MGVVGASGQAWLSSVQQSVSSLSLHIDMFTKVVIHTPNRLQVPKPFSQALSKIHSVHNVGQPSSSCLLNPLQPSTFLSNVQLDRGPLGLVSCDSLKMSTVITLGVPWGIMWNIHRWPLGLGYHPTHALCEKSSFEMYIGQLSSCLSCAFTCPCLSSVFWTVSHFHWIFSSKVKRQILWYKCDI